MLFRAVAINCVTQSRRRLAQPQLVEARAHVVMRALSQLPLDVLRKDVDHACPANTVFKRMHLGRFYLLL